MSKRYTVDDAFKNEVLSVGDVVNTNGNGGTYDSLYFTGTVTDVDYTLGKLQMVRVDGQKGGGIDRAWVIDKCCGGTIIIYRSTLKAGGVKATKIKKSKLEVERMLKEGVEDLKGFVQENRYVLYWVSLILLADHFIFGGEMRGKIQTLFNSIIDKVNTKINGDTPKVETKG